MFTRFIHRASPRLHCVHQVCITSPLRHRRCYYVLDTLLLRLIPGNRLSTCPHRQFHTQPGFLDSRAALSNSYPNACVQWREAVCSIFIMVFGMTRTGANPRPTVWEADTLTTKPTRHGNGTRTREHEYSLFTQLTAQRLNHWTTMYLTNTIQ